MAEWLDDKVIPAFTDVKFTNDIKWTIMETGIWNFISVDLELSNSSAGKQNYNSLHKK